MYAKRYNFTPSMAPFANMTHSPKCFTRKFPAPSKDQEAKSLAIWEEFLTPKLIAIRLRPSKNQIILLNYQPNLVSLHFSLNQVMPKTIFNKKSIVVLYDMYHAETECNEEMSNYVSTTQLIPIPFKPSYYCTQEYDTWWRSYYSTKMFDVLAFTMHLTTDFAYV